MKLCKDCKHYRAHAFGPATCMVPVPNPPRVCPVTGEDKSSHFRCGVMREHVCGIDARFFQPKPAPAFAWHSAFGAWVTK